jgi:hypothetical protein
MKHLKHILGVIMSLLLATYAFAQPKDNAVFEISAGFSVRGNLAIIDSSYNNGQYFDNRTTQEDKEVRFSVNVKNVKVTGLNFSGKSVSDPFFSYQTVTTVNGKFNSTKTKIEYVTVHHQYYQYSGDPNMSNTTELKHISFTMTNLEMGTDKKSYRIGPGTSGKLEKARYFTSNESFRTHNRWSKYSEELTGMKLTPQTPAYGSVNFLNEGGVVSTEPLAVRVRVNREGKSTEELKQALSIATATIAELSTIPGVILAEGLNTRELSGEIELQESGLVAEQSKVDTEQAAKSLDKKVDMDVWIDVTVGKSETAFGNTLAMMTFEPFTKNSALYFRYWMPHLPEEQIKFWVHFFVGRARG